MEAFFYHLNNSTLDNVLLPLLNKTLQLDLKSGLVIEDVDLLAYIDKQLWVKIPDSFIPHVDYKSEIKAETPIILYNSQLELIKDKGLGFDFAFLFAPQELDSQLLSIIKKRINIIIDGNDDTSLQNARMIWKQLKNENIDVKYWQEDQGKGWVLKN